MSEILDTIALFGDMEDWDGYSIKMFDFAPDTPVRFDTYGDALIVLCNGPDGYSIWEVTQLGDNFTTTLLMRE